MTARESAWLYSLVILSVLALVELFYLGGHNPWLEAFNNAGHLLVFGLLAVALLHLLKLWRPSLRARPVQAYLITFLLAVALGAASEAVQYFTARDADLGDLVRDAVGAASFLALYAALRDSDLRAARDGNSRLKPALLVVTLLLWLAGGWTLLVWTTAYAKRFLQLPALCDFNSRLSMRFVEPNGVVLDYGATSDETGDVVRGTRMRFQERDWPDYEERVWPGVELLDVYPNWTGHDSLVLELTVEGDRALLVALSAFDREHNNELADRFTRGYNLDPGRQRLAVSLGWIITGPVNRTLDMEHMKGMYIFSDSTAAGRSILLERLYLK